MAPTKASAAFVSKRASAAGTGKYDGKAGTGKYDGKKDLPAGAITMTSRDVVRQR